MKMVDMKQMHDPEKGSIGDCQRAVIASLLELPIESVPHFAQIAHDKYSESEMQDAEFWRLIQEFLRVFGYAYLTVPATSGHTFWECESDVYHDISGPSPRSNDYWHATVGCNGQIVHDPHPDRRGLGGDPSTWTCGFIVKICGKVRPSVSK